MTHHDASSSKVVDIHKTILLLFRPVVMRTHLSIVPAIAVDTYENNDMDTVVDANDMSGVMAVVVANDLNNCCIQNLCQKLDEEGASSSKSATDGGTGYGIGKNGDYRA